MKKLIITGMVVLSLGLMTSLPAMAEHGSKCSGNFCKYSGQKSDKACNKGGDEGYQCPITVKIMKKAHFFLDNQEAIGLTNDQIAKIKAIKHETAKGIILAGAHMKVFEMDLKQQMQANPIDQAGLNAMIDQSASGWGEGAKKSLQTYINLKATLTDSQMAKAKAIWSQK